MTASPKDSEETQRLLERIRAGEAGATDQLLERHRPYVSRLVELRLDTRLRSRLDPSDVVQEGMLEASRRLEKYLRQPALPFRLWLRRIAYDRLLMLHRRHLHAARRTVKRTVALPDGSAVLLAEGLLASGLAPSNAAVREELAERVRQCLDRLAADDREVLLLRNMEGLTNRETANVLGVDPATSSRRYGRAILRLRALLLEGGLEGLGP